MSELKVHNINDLSLHDIVNCEFYLKSDADKLIAELEERIADGDKDFEMANHQNERLLKIVRHQKYKRCLAMTKYCDMGLTHYNENLDSFSCERADFFYRWYNRWLELAKKFKPNNSTAQ